MRTGARLHSDHTRRQVGEERSHLITPKSPLQHRLASLVDAVDLEHVFRQIDANCRNVHVGRPFRSSGLMTLPLWHNDAVSGGGVHTIAIRHPDFSRTL